MMKIGLCAQLSEDCRTAANLERMERMARQARSEQIDLILFGEAYLHGFDAFAFDYAHDVTIAAGLASPEVAAVRSLARRYGVAIGFGFYENDRGALYAAYLIAGPEGEIVDHYRRVSSGWRKPDACADYRGGPGFHTFQFKDRTFAVIMCGDFWEDHLLAPICDLDPQVDAFLWPVHCDYPLTEWYDSACRDYMERSRILAKPVLWINNIRPEADRAQGGAYAWQQGRTVCALPYGKSGLLSLSLADDFGHEK